MQLAHLFSRQTLRCWPVWCGLGGVAVFFFLSSYSLSFVGQQEATEAKKVADAFHQSIQEAHQAWLRTGVLQGVLNLPNFLNNTVDFSFAGFPVGTTAENLTMAGNIAACHELFTEVTANRTPVFSEGDVIANKVSLPPSAYWCTQALGNHSCLYTYKACGDTVDKNYFIYNSSSGGVDFHQAHIAPAVN